MIRGILFQRTCYNKDMYQITEGNIMIKRICAAAAAFGALALLVSACGVKGTPHYDHDGKRNVPAKQERSSVQERDWVK